MAERLDYIYDFFKDDMAFRELEYDVKIEDELKQSMVLIDEARFSIVLYNLFSNSVKHTAGGFIKVSVKLIDQNAKDENTRACKTRRQLEDAANKKTVHVRKNSYPSES